MIRNRGSFHDTILSSKKAVLNKIEESAEFIEVTSEVHACRDPKDNFLLALAADGRADYLITGDGDLLVLQKIGKTKIITISEYLKND